MPPRLRKVVLTIAVIAIAVASWFSLYAAWLTTGLAIAAHLLVGATFAASLRPGREPLTATFCRMVRGLVPPECESYLRRLTVIWVVLMALLTVHLIVAAILWPAWMRVAAAVNFTLMIALYVGEHAVRIMVFPHLPRYSPLHTGRIVMQALRDRR